MLDNYKQDENGVIYQVNISKEIDYSFNYVENSYEKYGELPNYISYLRYGYLISSINDVIPTSILDFGYGNGAFLEVCKRQIVECYGYDVGMFGVPLNCKRIHKFEEIFNRHFDVITFFDSLEHVKDIYFLNKLDCDYIMISVPECHYFDDEWFKNWKHRREDEHLWHFSTMTLIKFMESQGFGLINVSNIEDVIRKPEYNYGNILTGVFFKYKK